ncbi:hypothetical protein D9M71_595030 [compost metagenome]
MSHLEERLAALERDLALVLVVEEGELGVQVELYRAAVAELHGLHAVTGFDVLVVVGQPALFPPHPAGQRQHCQGDGRSRRQRPPVAGAGGVFGRWVEVDDGGATRQQVGCLPDFQHRLIFFGMPRVGRQPASECFTLGLRAIVGVQAHAPMRCGVGDGIVWAGIEAVVVHCGSGFCAFYPCESAPENQCNGE